MFVSLTHLVLFQILSSRVCRECIDVWFGVCGLFIVHRKTARIASDAAKKKFAVLEGDHLSLLNGVLCIICCVCVGIFLSWIWSLLISIFTRSVLFASI